MALSFYADDTEKKKGKSFLDKAGDVTVKVAKKVGGAVKGAIRNPGEYSKNAGEGVGRAIFGSTAKFVNQGVEEERQYIETARMLAANATGNSDAWAAAKKRSDKGYENFKDSGGFFNAGTITNKEESKRGDFKTGATKIGAGTVGTATEVVPFARGASLAKTGGKVLPNVGLAAAEGAGYGAVGSTAEQIGSGEKFDFKKLAKDTLLGAATGGAGFGAGKAVESGVPKLKQGAQVIKDKNTELGEGGYIRLPSKGEDPKGSFTGADGKPRVEVDDSKATVSRLKDGYTDDLSNVLKHPTLYNDFPGLANIRVSVQKLPKGSKAVYSPDKNLIAVSPETASGPERFKSALLHETQHAIQNEQGLAAGTNLRDPDAYRNNLGEVEARSVQDRMNLTPSQRSLRPLGAGVAEQAPSTIDIDTRTTTPQAARTTVASSVRGKSMDGFVQPVQRAKTALVGKTSSTAEKPVTAVGEGAKTIAEKLDEQLKVFDKKFAAPKEIIDKLNGGDTVRRDTRKHDWLDHYEDTLSVLGRHFGKQGTDLGYKLAEGAKQVSDLQEVVRPSIDRTQKLLSKMSRSKAGRADIQQRVYAALEDRANAGQYIRNKQEQELFDETVKVLNFFKVERTKRGKAVVGEDYSPRAAVRNALDAPDRLFDSARSAFGRDVKSTFSKERVAKIPDAEINRNIIDLLPQYASSQSKEFGYEGAINFAKEQLQNINPAYLTDAKGHRQGTEYLQTLMKQVLDPPTVTKSERIQNKILATTYKNQLGFSLKYAFQNLTQRFATKAVVSKQADKLAKALDPADVDALRKEMISGTNPISGEATQTAESIGSKSDGFFKRFDPGTKVEKGNVENSFDRGVAEGIVKSEAYKDAISKGFKPKDAAKFALKDPATRDMAIRHGNVVTNDTQFGANFVTKPEFFRKSGTFFGISDKWFKQYQRFPQGMIQNMSTILRANDARALDILKRGNPAETNLVDFKYSAQALHNGVDDLIQGIKSGEISDVSLEVAEGYKKTLGKAIKQLDGEMKKVSQIRGGKTAKSVGKMWASASAIQFLFDGGFAMIEDDQNKEIRKSIQYGAPVSIPTKDQNPLAGALIPSSPFKPEFRPEKAANLIPGVGLAVNRGREINRFVKALTGDSE
jgi:hypothetical protein